MAIRKGAAFELSAFACHIDDVIERDVLGAREHRSFC